MSGISERNEWYVKVYELKGKYCEYRYATEKSLELAVESFKKMPYVMSIEVYKVVLQWDRLTG